MRLRPVIIALLGSFAFAGALPQTSVAGGGLEERYPGQPYSLTRTGAKPLNTSKTIPYWHGQFTDPTNGVTYGYNMVGANPARETTTVLPVDIIPLDFTFDAFPGYALNGSDVVARTLASPIFQNNDYSTTPAVAGVAGAAGIPIIAGGELSNGNTNAQYLDAIMRSQFNKIGTGYHILLEPIVWPAVRVKVPTNQGFVFRTPAGTVWGMQADGAAFDGVLASLPLDPTHLWILLTDNVFLGSSRSCCALGFHSTGLAAGLGLGQGSAQGDQPVPTWIYSAYVRPGTFNPATFPFIRDINTLSHEISEWADDPFINNFVNPWAVPPAAIYGCVNLLEIGDPVWLEAFAMPGNTYDAVPLGDGYWHPEDEVFLPWMARQAPNTTSQATQEPSAFGGRYSFMGDLNPYPDFHRPAPSC